MHRRAFTLIELLVVISIIAVLSSVVLASLNAAREKGRLAAARQFEANVYHAEGDQAVGIWDFDECSGSTTADRSGFGNTGTLNGGSSFSSDTPSGTGCSISFNGVDGFVDLGTNASYQFNLATDQATWTGWIKTTAGSQQTFLTYSNTYNPRLTINGSNMEWYYAGNITSQGSGLNNGLWHHIAVVNNATQVQFYIDGNSRGTGTSVSTATANQIFLGKKACPGCSDIYFNGKMDSVRVFSKAFTAGDVRRLYAEESARTRFASSAAH